MIADLRCPICRQQLEAHALHCPSCGLALWNRCPKCHAHNSGVARYCANCGLQLAMECPWCSYLNDLWAESCLDCSRSFIDAPDERYIQTLRLSREDLGDLFS